MSASAGYRPRPSPVRRTRWPPWPGTSSRFRMTVPRRPTNGAVDETVARDPCPRLEELQLALGAALEGARDGLEGQVGIDARELERQAFSPAPTTTRPRYPSSCS